MNEHLTAILEGRSFLTGAGTETYLAFHQGFDLREMCGFLVFDDAQAYARLERDFLEPIVEASVGRGHGLLYDALVWRASPDWLGRVGRPPEDVARINRAAVERTRASLERCRARVAPGSTAPMLVVADIGPRGDGYRVENALDPAAAERYHRPQLEALAEAGVDVAAALTMTHVEEAIGIVRVAAEVGLPIFVSPTVETDGRLPDGNRLGALIEQVDAATDGAPLFYMVNCAHPTHLLPVLEEARDAGEPWLERFRGFRANASTKSHAELDESPVLDVGDPGDLARRLAGLREDFGCTVLGGCCGTDASHIRALAGALAA